MIVGDKRMLRTHESVKRLLESKGWKERRPCIARPSETVKTPGLFSPKAGDMAGFWLEDCLKKLNPDRELYYKTEYYQSFITGLAIQNARAEKDSFALSDFHDEAHWYMMAGLRITVEDDEGREVKRTIKVVDWENLPNNTFEYVENWRGARNDGFSWDFVLCVNAIPVGAILLCVDDEGVERPCDTGVSLSWEQLRDDWSFPIYLHYLFVSNGEQVAFLGDYWNIKAWNAPVLDDEELMERQRVSSWDSTLLSPTGMLERLHEEGLEWFSEIEPWEEA